jgi:hypothetical protein
MALTALVLKISAKDEDVQKALASVGKLAKSTDEAVANIGNTPVGAAAKKSLEQMQTAMKAVAEGQQRLADRAVNMARGMDISGGAAKFTSDQLTEMSRTLAKGTDAFRALGTAAPAELTKATKAISDQQQALKATGASWESFVKGFNIQSAIATPMATARQAAFGFTDSMGGVALAAAATLAGLAAVGGALYKLASNAAAVGAHLDNMVDVTGMSVPALSRLQHAATVAGSDLGTLTAAVFKIEQRMGEGGAEWDKAVSKMGLSTEHLRAAGPDRLLQTITEGLAGIHDPADRAATGAALMGKTFKDVVPVLLDLDAAFALTNDITPWTAAQAKEAEAFEMQMSSLVVHAEAFGMAIGRWLIGPIGSFIGATVDAVTWLGKTAGELSGIVPLLRGIGKAWEFGAAAINVFRKAAAKLPPVAGDAAKGVAAWQKSTAALALAVPTLTDALITEEFASKDLARQLSALAQARTTAAAAVKAAADVQKQALADTLQRMEAFEKVGEEGAAAVTKGMQGLSFVLRDLAIQMGNLQIAATKSFAGMIGPIADLSGQAKRHMQQIADAGVSLGERLRDTFSQIPDMLMHAFEGGGGLIGAFKAMGVALSQAILQPLMAKLSAFQKAAVSTGSGVAAALGGAVGGGTGASIGGLAASLGGAALAQSGLITGAVALGAATAGIGLAAVGAYLAIKHFVTSTEKAINPLRQQFVDAAGGLDALNRRAQDAGVSLTAMLNARTPAQYTAAIDALNLAIGTHEQKVAEATSAVGALLKASVDLGIRIPEALKAPIQRLIDMKLITGDVAGEFARIAGSTEVDFKKMQATAEKYGINLAALGPQFASAKLSDAAKIIVNDFDMLVRGGADADRVLAGMAKPINAILNEAIKTGNALPKQFEPWATQLFKTGQLVDADGKKITDLSQLKFSDPLVTEFDKIVSKLQELIDKITGPLAKSITTIPTPTPIHIPIRFDIPDMPRWSEAKGFALGGRVQALASGGRVLPFLARGSDTVPAMLTPGEIVLNEAQQQHVAMALEGGRRVSTAAMEQKLDRLATYMTGQFARDMARTTRDELQKVVRR